MTTAEITIPSVAPPRVVTLIASATEIVSALGMRDHLVGRSHECDYPPEILSLPACSSPKIDVHGSSREIDDRVKAVLQQATSVYNVDAALLDQLEPTVIVTQTQCEVCAVSLKDVQAAVCELVRSQPQVVSCEPNALADVWEDIKRVAAALGVPERGEALVRDSLARLEAIRATAAGAKARPSIICIEWIDPLMAAGNWVPELVEIAGGTNLLGEAGKHSPWMTWDEVVAHDPDVLIVLPCGFDIPRSQAEMGVLTARPEWSSLNAVRAGRAWVADGNQFFNRPGPRLVESAEILAEMLHPDRFDFGHQGVAYVPA